MCMKNFNAEKIIFDKFTVFLTLPIFDHYVYRIMDDSAHFVKSTPCILLILRRYVTDIM